MLLFLALAFFMLDLSFVWAENGECLPKFKTNTQPFEVCKNKTECIIFLEQAPTVSLNFSEIGRNPGLQLPFPCAMNDRMQLSGSFFDIVKSMDILENAYCVYGGSRCTLDSLLEFVNSTSDTRYVFIAGGLLALLEYKTLPATIPSAAFLEDRAQIVTSANNVVLSAAESWSMVWKSFTTSAWALIFVCILLGVLARGWLAYRFSLIDPGPRMYSFLNRFRDNTPRSESLQARESWKRMNNSWWFIAKVFISIIFVLWEISVAVRLFSPQRGLRSRKINASEFGFVNNSAEESLYVASLRTKYSTKASEVYSSFNSYSELFHYIGRSKAYFFGGPRYTLMYSTHLQYEIGTKPEICDTLRVFDDVSRTIPTTSFVWYFNSNIDDGRRRKINKQIVRLKASHLHITEAYAGEKIPDACRLAQERVDWALIAILLFFAPGVLLSLFILQMIGLSFTELVESSKAEEDESENSDNESPVLIRRPIHKLAL